MHTTLFLACADMSGKPVSDGAAVPLLVGLIVVGMTLIGGVFALFHKL